MHGAENITDVAQNVRAASTGHFPPSSEARPVRQNVADPGGNGALATADQALGRLLGNSGFVDISAPFYESFTAGLRYQPVGPDDEDGKPGTLQQLVAAIDRLIAADPDESANAQARVPPRRAVRLLAPDAPAGPPGTPSSSERA